jgi:hypothetical protein
MLSLYILLYRNTAPTQSCVPCRSPATPPFDFQNEMPVVAASPMHARAPQNGQRVQSAILDIFENQSSVLELRFLVFGNKWAVPTMKDFDPGSRMSDSWMRGLRRSHFALHPVTFSVWHKTIRASRTVTLVLRSTSDYLLYRLQHRQPSLYHMDLQITTFLYQTSLITQTCITERPTQAFAQQPGAATASHFNLAKGDDT